jgi:hypothetical protein
MSIPKMRPSFLLTVGLTHDQAIKRIRGLVEHPDGRFTGKIVGKHIMLTVCEKDRHFWSPWLDMEVLEDEGDEDEDIGKGQAMDGGAVTVRGRFMPHPNIWTAYMAAYFGLVTFGLFAACFAYAQWVTESPPTALWGVGLSVVATVAVWWSAQVGQRLARGQMEVLREVVGEALG